MKGGEQAKVVAKMVVTVVIYILLFLFQVHGRAARDLVCIFTKSDCKAKTADTPSIIMFMFSQSFF